MFEQYLIPYFLKLGEAALYFIFGLLILYLGRKVWDFITKYNANVEIGENDNVSAGIAEFGFLIALAIIIMASVAGDKAAKVPAQVDLLVSVIYSIFGLLALALGKFFLRFIVPFNLDDEISRDKNQAAGWLQAGFYIAIAIILYGVL
jgi:uncharacterized membrane protein YjfL (UPF0719 family)